MSLVGQVIGFKAFVASQRLVHSFLCCSRKAFSECLSIEYVNQYKASTSYPPPWVTPLGVWISKDWFVQIPTFLVKKNKRHLIPLRGLYNSGSNTLPHPGKTQIPHPWEGLFFSNVYFLGTDYSQVPVGGWGGGRYVEALNRLAQQNQGKKSNFNLQPVPVIFYHYVESSLKCCNSCEE